MTTLNSWEGSGENVLIDIGEDIGEVDYQQNTWVIFLLLSPILLAIAVLLIVTFAVILDIIRMCIKNKIKTCSCNYKKPKLIVNGKLSKGYIKQLNKNNKNNKNNKKYECSICIETIKPYEKKIVHLNCSHKFHSKCLQKWVKTQTSSYINPTCPMDRIVIIDIPK